MLSERDKEHVVNNRGEEKPKHDTVAVCLCVLSLVLAPIWEETHYVLTNHRISSNQ